MVSKDNQVESGFVVNSLFDKRGKYLFRKTNENFSEAEIMAYHNILPG